MKTLVKTNRKKAIETTLPVFSGFYNSYWEEPNFESEAEHFDLPSNFPFYDFVKWNDYRIALCKVFCKAIENQMSDFVDSIEFKELDSPDYYNNFTNDKIVCLIRPKNDVIQKYIYDNKEAFTTYIHDHFTSCDGFISFHSNDFKDWEKDTKKFTKFSNEYVKLGAVLQFICEQENILEDILYEAGNEVSVSEFYSDDFYRFTDAIEGLKDLGIIKMDAIELSNKIGEDLPNIGDFIKEVTEYIKFNYTKLDSLECKNYFESLNEHKCIEYVDLNLLIMHICNEIESNTLNIAF